MGHPVDIFLSTPDNTLICAICHDVLKNASSFKACGHTFCARCISDCLATSPNCPTCRKPVQTGSNPNFSLRDIIDKLEVKCPESSSSSDGSSDDNSPSKRLKTTGEENEGDVDGEDSFHDSKRKRDQAQVGTFQTLCHSSFTAYSC